MLHGFLDRLTIHPQAGKIIKLTNFYTADTVRTADGEEIEIISFSDFWGDDLVERQEAKELLKIRASILHEMKKNYLNTQPSPTIKKPLKIKQSILASLTKKELITLVMETNGGLIRGPEDANKFFADFAGLVKDWYKEHFIVLCLNTKNFVIHSEVVSMGHLTASLVHPREVFKNVLTKQGTAGVIIGHNHPSGDPSPSDNDKEITEMIKKAGDFLGIPLLDHVIFTKIGKYYSFNEKGLI